MSRNLYGLANPSLLHPYSGVNSLQRGVYVGHKEIRFENLDFRYPNIRQMGGMPFADLSDIISEFLSSALGRAPFDATNIKCYFVNCAFDVAIIGNDVPRVANMGRNISQSISLWEMNFLNCMFEEVTVSSEPATFFLLFKSSKIARFILTMEEAQESIPTQLHVVSCEIGEVEASRVSLLRRFFFTDCFVGIDQGEIDFSSSRFLASVSFKGTYFEGAPRFFSAQLPQDIEFQDAFFRDASSPGAWRAYRCLKHHMGGFSSDHEVQMFHALELESRYNTELPKGWKILSDPKGVETIASYFMRQLNNYGQHLWLPLIWLLYIGCWFVVLYAASGGVGYFPVEGKEVAGWVESVGKYYSNVTFAARNFFGPFGLILSADEIQPNNLLVKSLGVAHFLASSLIWFIWILQIRSRFKL